MARKTKLPVHSRPPVGIGVYILLAYWVIWAVIHVTIDLFLDLYTDEDYISAFWYAVIIATPFAVYSIYLARHSLLTAWYTYLFFPIIIFGMYLGSAYSTALKLDLLFSAMAHSETVEVMPILKLHKVIARKGGFIHTDVTLHYRHKSVTFKGTRTSYFLLKDYSYIEGSIGRSYLGSYYITHIDIPVQIRWQARLAYFKNWFSRYWWLLIGFPVFIVFNIFADKYFRKGKASNKPAEKPYLKMAKQIISILLLLFGLFMVMLLLIALFY